jgi:O-antigen/teichoic acid export membrane protein
MAYLRIRGRLREAAIATWVTLTLTISATWLLLPPLGLEGAGVGWAAGKFAGLCVALALLARGRAVRPPVTTRA